MNTPAHLLIVEDEHALGAALALAARQAGHLPVNAASGTAALAMLGRQKWDAVVLDIGLPDVSGLEVLARLRERDARLPVLVITAHATLEHALGAQKNGATLYLPKPLDLAHFEGALQTLLSGHAPVAATAPPAPKTAVATLIGSAPAMQPVFLGIARACAGPSPVLIVGPTGSGKSLTASIIHAHRGAGGALEVCDCRQIAARQALEDWLDRRREAGAAVLDEADALDSAAQSALAAGLAAGVVPPLLLTTRAEPETAGPEFGLAPELFYAVSANVIHLPPLRRRGSDIPALAAFFLGLRGGDGARVLTAPALAALQRYDWPGNVRELRHVLDAAAALSHDGRLFAGHLPAHVAGLMPDSAQAVLPGELEALLARWLDQHAHAPYDQLLDTLETALLRHLLERHEGKVTRLAAAHRLNRATLRQKLRRLGLDGASERE